MITVYYSKEEALALFNTDEDFLTVIGCHTVQVRIK